MGSSVVGLRLGAEGWSEPGGSCDIEYSCDCDFAYENGRGPALVPAIVVGKAVVRVVKVRRAKMKVWRCRRILATNLVVMMGNR